MVNNSPKKASFLVDDGAQAGPASIPPFPGTSLLATEEISCNRKAHLILYPVSCNLGRAWKCGPTGDHRAQNIFLIKDLLLRVTGERLLHGHYTAPYLERVRDTQW